MLAPYIKSRSVVEVIKGAKATTESVQDGQEGNDNERYVSGNNLCSKDNYKLHATMKFLLCRGVWEI